MAPFFIAAYQQAATSTRSTLATSYRIRSLAAQAHDSQQGLAIGLGSADLDQQQPRQRKADLSLSGKRLFDLDEGL